MSNCIMCGKKMIAPNAIYCPSCRAERLNEGYCKYCMTEKARKGMKTCLKCSTKYYRKRNKKVAYNGCNLDCFNCPYSDCIAPHDVAIHGINLNQYTNMVDVKKRKQRFFK